MKKIIFYLFIIFLTVVATLAIVDFRYIAYIFPPLKPEKVKVSTIADDEFDPYKWGQVFPHEYDAWTMTIEKRPSAKSKYKKGGEDTVYDRLSEFPYMALLLSGYSYGVEYNETRGHRNMMIDQSQVDPARTLEGGGACLVCKSPYADKLVRDTKKQFLKMPYQQAAAMIPEQYRQLGVACIDCHDNKSMNLRAAKWMLKDGLETVGHSSPNIQEMRTLVCAQCHSTYVFPKDAENKVTDIVFPWAGSKWGDISIENIIKEIKSKPEYLEWKQSVTGFKLGYIRHPDFELFSRGSVHFRANTGCADCHMRYKRVGADRISSHNQMSPLKDDVKSCVQCHTQTVEWLRESVIKVQDRTIELSNKAGYATAVVAKLFELAHNEQAGGKKIDAAVYDKAKDLYTEAFYRVIYLCSENSIGFHNPAESERIAKDAADFASKAEAALRQGLLTAGAKAPEKIELELAKYVNERGSKKLKFKPEQELRSPSSSENSLNK